MEFHSTGIQQAAIHLIMETCASTYIPDLIRQLFSSFALGLSSHPDGAARQAVKRQTKAATAHLDAEAHPHNMIIRVAVGGTAKPAHE